MNKIFNKAVVSIAGFAVCFGLGAGMTVPAFAENNKSPGIASPSTGTKEVPSVLENSNLDGKRRTINEGDSVKLTGTLNGGVRKVEIKEYNNSTKEWKVIKSMNTNSSGTFSHTVKPSASLTTYNLYAPATKNVKSYTGKATYFNVKPKPVEKPKPVTRTATKLNAKILDGKTKYYKKGTKLTVSGTVSGGARTVNIVKYDSKSKKWNVIATKKSNSKGSFSIPLTLNSSGNYSVSVPGTSKYNPVASYSTSLTISAVSPKVSTVKSSFSRVVPWSTGTVSGSVSGIPTNSTFTATIQEKSGKSWKNVATHKNKKSGNFTLNLPKGTKSSANATKTYRIQYSGTGVKTAYSNTFKVIWDNPLKGSAMEKKTYNYMKSYCPNTPIVISSLSADKAWGRAYMGTKNTIVIDPKVPSKHLQTVSLHECAHFVQWKQYGKGTTWDNFKKDMNKIYGTKGNLGMEQNADCIANYWKKNSYWGYKGNCNGKKGTVAKAIATGKRY